MKLTRRLIKRRLVLVALCILGGLTLSVAAQQPPNAAQTPVESMSLKQATDWLKESLIKNSSRYDLSTNRLTKLEQVRFDDCSLKYIEATYFDDLRIRQRQSIQMEIALNLSDIDPAMVRLVEMSGFWAVAYPTLEHKPAIARQMRLPGQSAKKMDMYYFPFQKRELGEPVASVLVRAINQCSSHK
jgi:hypothetical protein